MNNQGRENVVQTADNMSLNDLCGDVGDESLLLDLLSSSSEKMTK